MSSPAQSAASKGLMLGGAIWAKRYPPTSVNACDLTDPRFEAAVKTLLAGGAISHENNIKPNPVVFDAPPPSAGGTGSYNWSEADAVVNWAKANGIPDLMLTSVIWPQPQSWAPWMRAWGNAATPTQVDNFMVDYITRTMQRYPQAKVIHGFNEFLADGPDAIYPQDANGIKTVYGPGAEDPNQTAPVWWTKAPNMFVRGYQVAKTLNPNIALIYNDYGLEANSYKRLICMNLLNRLLAAGVKIELGIQGHQGGDAGFGPWLDTLPCPFHITEFDTTNPTAAASFLNLVTSKKGLRSINIWACLGPIPAAWGEARSVFDDNMQPNSVYTALTNALTNAVGTGPVTPPPTPGPTPMPSTDGTLMPPAQSLIDSAGASWTWGRTIDARGDILLRNGVEMAGTAGKLAGIFGGFLVHANAQELAKPSAQQQWWKYANGAWSAATDPRPPVPVFDQAAARVALTKMQGDLDNLKVLVG